MLSPATIQEMTERHAGVLAELTGIFMEAARQSGADIAEAETPEAKKEACDRLPALGRAVRLCLALEGRIVRDGLKDVQAAQRAELTAGQEAAEAADKARRAERYARKALVLDRVDRAIEEAITYHDEEELEPHYEDLRTRLDDETFEAEFAHLPYEEVVRIVHRDLKLPEPVFEAQDRVRALIWAAQWGHPPPEAPEPQVPEPDPSPEPYFRYSSG